MTLSTMELAPKEQLSPPTSEGAEVAVAAIDQGRLATLGAWAVGVGNRAVDKITSILPDRIKTQTAIMLGASAFGGAAVATNELVDSASAANPSPLAQTAKAKASKYKPVIKTSRSAMSFGGANLIFSGVGGSELPRATTIRETKGSPITTRNVAPDVYSYGVETPVKVQFITNKKNDLTKGLKRVKGYVEVKDFNVVSGAENKEADFKISLGKKKSIYSSANFAYCAPWHSRNSNPNDPVYKGFTMIQPSDYPCDLGNMNISWGAEIHVTGYKGKRKVRKSAEVLTTPHFTLEQIKIINPPQPIQPTKPTGPTEPTQ